MEGRYLQQQVRVLNEAKFDWFDTFIMFSLRALAESLDRCVDPNDPEVNYLLRSLATYAMVQALYFSTGEVNFKRQLLSSKD